MHLKLKITSKNALTLFGVGAVILFLSAVAIYAVTTSILIPTFHLDGAFQTASGLYRLNANQLPGRDFLPYLGIGPVFLVYPMFKLLGADLVASVSSAQFITMLCGWSVLTTIFHLLFRAKMLLFSALMGAIAFFAFVSGGDQFQFYLHAGTSLRPLRSAIPYFAAMVGFLVIQSRFNRKYTLVFFASILGLIMLWSNDYAVPTTLTACLFLLFFVYAPRGWIGLRDYVILGILSLVIWGGALWISTGGHPLALIGYNLFDVAKDQWWYFSSYSPESRIFNMSDVFSVLYGLNSLPFAVLVVLSAMFAKTRHSEYLYLIFIGISLFLGGLLASVGGHLANYFEPFFLWGFITIRFSIILFAWNLLKRRTVFFLWISARSSIILFPTALVSSVVLLGLAVTHYNKVDRDLKNNAQYFYVLELGGYLGTQWTEYIDQARVNKSSAVYEEYWGIWSAVNRVFPPVPVDASIHALGRMRIVVSDKLSDVQKIITTRYEYSKDWQPWNLSQNFWLYDELFRNWTPELTSPSTIVWTRSAAARSNVKLGCVVTDDGQAVRLNTAKAGYYKINLQYRLSGQGRFLLMFKNNISFGDDANGYVSLDPQQSSSEIPVLVHEGQPAIFDSKIVGGENKAVQIESCTAEEIGFKNKDVLAKAW